MARKELPKEKAARLLDKTADGRSRKKSDDPVKPLGVGLKQSEGHRLTEIAGELGVNRHQLLLFVVRDFMQRWDDGERPQAEDEVIKITKKKLISKG
jgi:hypothetical protein